MRLRVFPWRITLAVLLTLDCGGGGGGTTPTQVTPAPTPVPVVPVEAVTLSVPQGQSLSFEYSGSAPKFTPSLTWEVRGTAPAGATWIRLILVRQDGARCWGDSQQVTIGGGSWKGSSFSVMGSDDVPCGDQHTTATMEVQFLRAAPVWGPSRAVGALQLARKLFAIVRENRARSAQPQT